MRQIDLRYLLKAKGINLTGLAALIGVDKATTTRWSQRRIPAERVLQVEKVTGVPRHELRPDIYPPTEVEQR